MPFKLQWSICLTFPAHISVASEIIAKWRRFSLKHDELELFNLLRVLDKELENWFNHTNPRIMTTNFQLFGWFVFVHYFNSHLKDRTPRNTGLNGTCKTWSAKLMSPCWQVFKSRRPWKLEGQKRPGNCLKRSNRRCSGIRLTNNFLKHIKTIPFLETKQHFKDLIPNLKAQGIPSLSKTQRLAPSCVEPSSVSVLKSSSMRR